MSQPSETSTTKKTGSINKCPSCGAQLGAFVSSCDSCGHEITDIEANRSITELVRRFDEIEKEVYEKGLMTSNGREKEIIRRKARVIRDFPVPNSREDIQQLLFFIQPKLVDSVKPDPNMEDWRAKFVEVITRARNAYKGDTGALAEFEQIEKSLDTTMADDLKIKAKRNPLFVTLLGGVVVLGSIGLVMAQMEKAKVEKCEVKYTLGAATEKAKLEAISVVANEAFTTKKYPEALSAAAKIRWEYEEPCKVSESQQAKAMWEEKRAQMTALIQTGVESDSVEKKAEADRLAAEKQAEVQKVSEVAKAEAAKIEAKAIAVKKAVDDKKW